MVSDPLRAAGDKVPHRSRWNRTSALSRIAGGASGRPAEAVVHTGLRTVTMAPGRDGGGPNRSLERP